MSARRRPRCSESSRPFPWPVTPSVVVVLPSFLSFPDHAVLLRRQSTTRPWFPTNGAVRVLAGLAERYRLLFDHGERLVFCHDAFDVWVDVAGFDDEPVGRGVGGGEAGGRYHQALVAVLVAAFADELDRLLIIGLID